MAPLKSRQQQSDRGAVARRHQRDRSLGKPGLAQALHQAIMDRAAGAETVGAAAQDDGVARFQAEHAGIGRDIGAAFEDHRDDAERHANAFDGHAVGALPALGHDADRILDRAHGRDSVGHGVDAALGQRQPVDEGGGGAGRASFSDVFGIGGENRCRVGADGALDGIQRLILLLGRGERQRPRGIARAGSESVHQLGQIGVAVDGFQRRGHVCSSCS